MAFWGVYVKPGEPFTLRPDYDGRRLRVTQATLGEQFQVEGPRTVLQCALGHKQPISVCSLSMNKQQCCPLILDFEELEDVVFSVVGSHGVYLAGCYLDRCAACRTNCDGADGFVIRYYDQKASEKAENVDKKTLNTTRGAENEEGKMPTTEAVENVKDKELSIAGETETEKDKSRTITEVDKKKDKKMNALEEDIENTDSSLDSPLFGSEDTYDSNDSFIDDSSLSVQPSMQKHLGVEAIEKPKSTKRSSKGPKRNQSTESDVDERPQQKPRTVKSSSYGIYREPECKIRPGGTWRAERDKLNHFTAFGKPESDFDANSDLKARQWCSADMESQRKKKKKKTESVEERLPSGILVQELAKGKPDGQIAAQGRKVKILYTAWIKETRKVLDSNIGQAPFKFELGDEEIIKGWNIGIEGMRVGDKRRLMLRPGLGSWKINERAIPPDSTLVYDIELVSVR